MKRWFYIKYAIFIAWLTSDKIYVVDLQTKYKLFSLRKLKLYNKMHDRKTQSMKRITMNEINHFKIFETKYYEKV